MELDLAGSLAIPNKSETQHPLNTIKVATFSWV